MTKSRAAARKGERGFALLLVFLLAAAIAISLYMELPRVAFETQRNREQLLVDRGQEYQRAVQLFVRANKRYPAKIEDLESFNDKRYLRRRFVNPFSGKDDWRMVHVGPNGMLTDSLVPKNKNPLGGPDDKNKDQQASNTDPNSGSGNDPNTGGGLNLAKNQRPSDRMAGQMPAMGSSPPPGTDPQQQQAGAYPPQPGQAPFPGQAQYPGQYPGQQFPPPQFPGQAPNPAGGIPPNPGQPYTPGQPFPGQPGQFPTGQPMPPGVQPGQQVPGQPTPFPGQPGQFPQTGQPGNPGQTAAFPGQPMNPGQQPNQPFVPGQMPNTAVPPGQQPYNNPSAQMNPSGQFNPTPGTGAAQANPGLQAVQQRIFGPSSPSAFNNPQQGAGMGTGIAGVGVPAEMKGAGIMLIKDRSKYREWEFIYDPKEDKTVVGAAGAQQQQQMQQQQQQQQTKP